MYIYIHTVANYGYYREIRGSDRLPHALIQVSERSFKEETDTLSPRPAALYIYFYFGRSMGPTFVSSSKRLQRAVFGFEFFFFFFSRVDAINCCVFLLFSSLSTFSFARSSYIAKRYYILITFYGS